jgi:hypothetical protein
MYTFLKLETTVSVQCSPWFFTWGRECKEPKKPGKFSQETPPAEFPPLPWWNGSLWHRLIVQGVELSSWANSIFRDVLSLPGIAKLLNTNGHPIF